MNNQSSGLVVWMFSIHEALIAKINAFQTEKFARRPVAIEGWRLSS